MSDRDRAMKIARAIFACGDNPTELGGTTQRIQFMGGTWPDNERALGGLCEAALVGVIERVLAVSESVKP